MPKRSNLFQEVMAIVQQHINDDDTEVSESKELPDGFTGQLREVDICIEREIPGSGREIIGIECRDHNRKQSIEWVEQMFGKHHLLTDKLILISRSGFTGPALTKAAALRVLTITPQSSEELRDTLIGQLKELWAKTFRHMPTGLKYLLEFPDGSIQEFRTGIGGPGAPNVFNAAGELEAEGNDFIMFMIQSIPPDNDAYRDAESGDRNFTVQLGCSDIINEQTGEQVPLFVHDSDNDVLARIVGVELSGIIRVGVGRLQLSHSEFGGVAYSYGKTAVGKDEVLVVSTQAGDAEPRSELRVVWGDPADDASPGSDAEAKLPPTDD
ncbi:hypothetical protein ACTD5D_10005 [Nocardia takedensis]|uniref:hypothetical protein n=1 Tax=Nocardia takedensis TaxID=259390 RepID=UPI003F762414